MIAPVPDVHDRARAAVRVTALRLRDFRSFPRLELESGGGSVVLLGDNGAGKSNLLEAISLLAPGRGMRGARQAELGRDLAPSWSIAARVETEGGGVDLVTGVVPGQVRRDWRIDGAARRRGSDIASRIGIAWLTPAMDRLLVDGTGERRRFLDRLVLGSDPAYGKAFAVYARDLRERTEVLSARPLDTAWLAVLERRLAENGVAIAAARRALVADLNTVLATADHGFPRPVLDVRGEVESWLDAAPALAVEDRLRQALLRSRTHDAETGGAATGPHRSDLVVRDARDGTAAALMSTGRQKAMLVAIVLAQARLRRDRQGEAPILLLDEVAAHLDTTRRAELAQALDELGAQAWLTGTDAAPFAALRDRARFIQIVDGVVVPA
jgi:DNA replication and repair protein RecF